MTVTKKNFDFPKTKRLLKRKEFLSVQDKGNKLFSRLFTVYFFIQSTTDPSGNAGSKVGITVSKKVSKHANRRNLIRRRIREIFRICVLPNLKQQVQFVVIAKTSALEADFGDLKKDLLGLLARKKLLLLQEGPALKLRTSGE